MESYNASQKELQQQLEIALKDAKDLYAKAPVGYYSLNADGLIVQLNEKFLSWLEAEECDVLGSPLTQFFDAKGQELFRTQFQKFKREGFIEGLEIELIGLKGRRRKVSVSATAMYDQDGVLLRSRSVMFDITELDAAKSDIESQNKLLEGVVEGLPFGVALFDDRQILNSHNNRFTQLLGYTDEVLSQSGFSFRDLIRMNGERGDYGSESLEDIYGRLSGLMKQHLGTHFERETHDGEWLSVSGIPVFKGWTLLTYVDITASKQNTLELEKAQQAALKAIAEQKIAHDEAQYIAFHDPLTGLPNRRLFADRAEQAVAVAARQDQNLAICYLDLDGFKKVNDTHGHEAGDKLLIAIAKRLTECVRAHDTVCRLGGDEFVLLLTHFEREEEVNLVLQRILLEIAKPVAIEQNVTEGVSVSIGYSLFPQDALEKGLLMRHADRAMYEAKRQGKNCILRHRPDQ